MLGGGVRGIDLAGLAEDAGPVDEQPHRRTGVVAQRRVRLGLVERVQRVLDAAAEHVTEREPTVSAGPAADRAVRDDVVGRVFGDRQPEPGTIGAAHQLGDTRAGDLPVHLVAGRGEQIERRHPGQLGRRQLTVVRRRQAVELGPAAALPWRQLRRAVARVECLARRFGVGHMLLAIPGLSQVEQSVGTEVVTDHDVADR